LNIPLKIAVATTKASYKPSLQIYEELFTKPIDKTKSFMCGDALGRPNDHSDCDLKFAEAIGIKILSPEELFPFDKKDTPIVIKPSETQEIVIMVGMPGSGKSHLAKTFTKPFSKPFTKTNYVIIEGDIYKTSEKMIKAAIPHLDKGTSVVFDATNPTREKRKEYITVAERYKIPVRCIYMNTSMEEAIARNNLREKPVPRIVYNVYNKKFQVPDSTYENCSVIIL
jgi:bifunctional polynucleotide phosphatase/kinase